MKNSERGRWWATRIVSDAIREAENNGYKKMDIAEATGRSLATIRNLAVGTDAAPSLPCLILMAEEFRLKSVAEVFCKFAGGVFVKAPEGDIDEQAISLKYASVLREEGEDADKIASLLSGGGSTRQINNAIADLQETIQQIAGLILLLEAKKDNA